jgi:membrane dipeptidase
MRLVDLHCDWLRQYATETTLYDGRLYPEVPGRVGRLDGYLLGTTLTVLVCARKPAEGAGQPEHWGTLGLMLARYEAEFAGRIIREAGDVSRWRSSPPDGLCWGLLGVAGFDGLVRGADDLDRLPALFARGVRMFQPIAGSGGVLGGSSEPGDDRGLSDLGRAFLQRLAGLAADGEAGPRPILDLAGMNAATMADAFRWLDEDASSRGKLLLAASHGTAGYRGLLEASSADLRSLEELRLRGGVIGLTPGLPGCETVEELKALVDRIAGIPVSDQDTPEGIAIGSDLLGVESPLPGMESARGIARWFERSFDRKTAAALVTGNARRLLLRSAGAEE